MTEPRTWALPPEPKDVERVRDDFGAVWTRQEGVWHDDGEERDPRDWPHLLMRGPLAEVVETEVEAAARRLREAGFTTRHTAGYAGAYEDLLALARHVLNGGAL